MSRRRLARNPAPVDDDRQKVVMSNCQFDMTTFSTPPIVPHATHDAPPQIRHRVATMRIVPISHDTTKKVPAYRLRGDPQPSRRQFTR